MPALYWRIKEIINNMEGELMNNEAVPMNLIDAMDLIEFANEWNGLGDAITVQVMYVCAHDFSERGPTFDHDEVNQNAIKEAEVSIGGYNDEIDAAIADYWKLIDAEKKKEESEFYQPYLDARCPNHSTLIDGVAKIRNDLIEGAIEDDPGEDGEEETEECAPTAEAIRLIRSSNP